MLFIYFLCALITIWFILIFNKIVKLKNMVGQAFSDVDVQLKRRYDLIPNLVETVKGISEYEKSLFENIANSRNQSIVSQNISERSNHEQELTTSFKNIFAIAENYPEVKSNKNFLELHKSLVDVEEQIQYARRYYNGTVRDFNILIEVFPNNIIAKVFNYKKEEYFELESATQSQNPEVNL